MNKIFTVIKKDLKRFFTDKRILLGLFLPGVLIFVMYTFMGDIIADSFMPSEEYTYTVYAKNYPADLGLDQIEGMKIEITDAADKTDEEIKGLVQSGEIDLYVVFEDDFINKILSYDPSSGLPAPKVELSFNSASTESSTVYNTFGQTLTNIEDGMRNMFDIASADCATAEDLSATFITMLLPMLLMMLLWSGCMMVSAESIAGEKERGTIATLLVTPIKRSHLAIAKVISLSMTALISAVVSFAGTMLSLPKLFAGMDVSLSIYGFGEYAALFATIVVTVLLFTIVLLIISTYAKSVKEATSLSSAAMIAVMVVAVMSMIGSAITSPVAYIVPIFNAAQCLTAILSLSFSPVNFLICLISNAVYIGLGIWLITKMFGSEKVMFNK